MKENCNKLYDAENNLNGFFALLFKIDQRLKKEVREKNMNAKKLEEGCLNKINKVQCP